VAGAIVALQRRMDWRLLLWIGCSFAAVCVGGRFVPRYFLQLLPPLVIVAARGIVTAYGRFGRCAVLAVVLLLLVPLIRFGPRYVELAFHPRPHWSDARMDEDSQRAAAYLRALRKPGDTLFVWGYRPDIYVYARMIPPGPFWDSQPLTGVPADRHLFISAPVYGGPAEHNRQILISSKPTFIVDGLGLLNPHLSPRNYPDVRNWLQQYREVAHTQLSVIYRRK
jgi:hypothetical protein